MKEAVKSVHLFLFHYLFSFSNGKMKLVQNNGIIVLSLTNCTSGRIYK